MMSYSRTEKFGSEIMEQIAEWLKEKRTQAGLSLVDLSNKAKFSQPSISRIESGDTEISLLAAVRLMISLGYSWQTIFEEGFVGQGSPLPNFFYSAKPEDFDTPCFTWSDFDVIDQMQLVKKGIAQPIARGLIRLFMDRSISEIDPFLKSAIIDHFFNRVDDDVTSIDPKYFPQLQQGYPRNFPKKLMYRILLSKGVLIFKDIGALIRSHRLEQSISLNELSKIVDLSAPGLYFMEIKTPDKIKMKNLIALDKALDFKGELIVFAWHVAEFYLGVHRLSLTEGPINPWQPSEIRFFEKLVVTSRLFQQFYPEDRSWLDWYREQALEKFHTVLRS